MFRSSPSLTIFGSLGDQSDFAGVLSFVPVGSFHQFRTYQPRAVSSVHRGHFHGPAKGGLTRLPMSGTLDWLRIFHSPVQANARANLMFHTGQLMRSLRCQLIPLVIAFNLASSPFGPAHINNGRNVRISTHLSTPHSESDTIRTRASHKLSRA